MSEQPVLVKKFEKEKKSLFQPKVLGLVVLVCLLGIGTGYLLSNRFGSSSEAKNISREVSESEIRKGTIVGITDEKTFKDSAEGELVKGGIDGEGSHRLERSGGESQNVYLTSSIVDLDKFVGKKVKVWGETFAAQKAGWLMDVGKLEVLN
jgi:hypothetical protein